MGLFCMDGRGGFADWVLCCVIGVPDGGLHLRVVFETGDKRYYWLNNVVGKSLCCGIESGGNGCLDVDGVSQLSGS